MGPSQPMLPCSSRMPTSSKLWVKCSSTSSLCGVCISLSNAQVVPYVCINDPSKFNASTTWSYIAADGIYRINAIPLYMNVAPMSADKLSLA